MLKAHHPKNLWAYPRSYHTEVSNRVDGVGRGVWRSRGSEHHFIFIGTEPVKPHYMHGPMTKRRTLPITMKALLVVSDLQTLALEARARFHLGLRRLHVTIIKGIDEFEFACHVNT
jgi:hypothetical protein